jgi:Capsule assembly protein Wzi
MFFPRPHGRVAKILWLGATVFALLLVGQITYAQTPDVQTPTNTPASSQPAVPGSIATQNSTGQSVPASIPVPQSSRPALPPYAPNGVGPRRDSLGSAYIPVDSIVYPMALRLYSMGYLDTAFITMRPWTRRSLLHMLEQSSPAIIASGNDQAIDLLAKLDHYIASEGAEDTTTEVHFDRGNVYGVQSVYTRILGISGQTLNDSFHLGQTIAQDYGRPYEPGVNNITGVATLNEWWRLSLYVRGEYEHSAAGTGYSTTPTGNPLAPNGLAEQLSFIDEIPYSGYNLNQTTIPASIIAAQNPFRLQEATLSFHVLGHEISGGKSDSWDGPGLGSAMNWSNNAEDIYSFRINRVEPLSIPWVSRVLGPVRYDFFVGSLKGHSAPNEPWVHSEMFSFAPTSNFQFAFSRTVIWGGHGHGCLPLLPNGTYTPCDEPITFHTFFKSFFSVNDTNQALKYSVNDPGARYSDFSFSWRLPFVNHHLTLYTDSISHDDVSPLSAPRRAAYRPGIYLSQVPGLPKLDFRVEGVSTDCSTNACMRGQTSYWEVVQLQGYTNKGFIMGDWIGREAMGGQAWLTYHLSANEWVQFEYMKKRTPADFIPGGTSQNQYKIDVVKRLGKDVELDAWLQVERWKAPIYIQKPDNGANFDNAVAFQLTWFPKLHEDAKNVRPGSQP